MKLKVFHIFIDENQNLKHGCKDGKIGKKYEQNCEVTIEG